MQMQYLDFDLEIEQDAGRDYKIVTLEEMGRETEAKKAEDEWHKLYRG